MAGKNRNSAGAMRARLLVGQILAEKADDTVTPAIASMSHVWGLAPAPSTVAVVGAPLCDGQDLAGVELAPDSLRKAGIETAVRSLDWGFDDRGDVRGLDIEASAAQLPAADDEYYGPEMVKNCLSVGAGVGGVYERVSAAAADGRFVLTIGGDHSIAAGSIPGIMKHRPELAVVWVDAHGDCNTPETSPSKNYHGMPMAHVMGWFSKRVRGFEWWDAHEDAVGILPETRVAHIALRDVDPMEKALLRESGVHVFTMTEIDRYGIGAVMRQALDRIDPKGKRPLHLSFDVDSCDPSIAPGTGTKARGGLSYREAHYICEHLAATRRLGSMDLVEINPSIDAPIAEGMHGDDPTIQGTETVRLGIELVASALGKTIK